MHKSERYSQFVFGWDWESQIDSRVNLLSPMYGTYIYTYTRIINPTTKPSSNPAGLSRVLSTWICIIYLPFLANDSFSYS